MQPVRKKKRRKKPATAIIAICVAAFAGLVMLWYLKNQPEALPPPSAQREAAQQIRLINRQEKALSAFQVFPPGRNSYRLVRGEKGFQVEGQPDFALDEQMVSTMVEDLTTLSAEKAGDINEVKGGAEALGIDGQHFRVIAEYDDASRITFSFGNPAYTEIPSDYLMLSGDSAVYMVSPQIRNNLDHPLGALHPIPKINFNSDLVDSVEVSVGEEAFTLAQTGVLWQVASPFRYPADRGAVAALKKNINSMRLAVYVGQGAENNLAEYGLLSPRMTVRFNLAESVIITPAQDDIPVSTLQVPAQHLEFAIGDDIDNIGFYCLYKGCVYQASYASMGFLTTLSREGFLAKNPVIIPINQLLSLQVIRLDSARCYGVELVERIEKNNALAVDASGQQIYDPVITRDNQEIDQETFVMEYLKLMDVGNRGKLPPDFVPAGRPVVRYVFEAEGGAKLDMAFYPYDALHLAMAVNGQALYYTTRQAVEDIAL